MHTLNHVLRYVPSCVKRSEYCMPEDAGCGLVRDGCHDRLGSRALAALGARPLAAGRMPKIIKEPGALKPTLHPQSVKPISELETHCCPSQSLRQGPCQACWKPSQIVGDTSQVGCSAQVGSYFSLSACHDKKVCSSGSSNGAASDRVFDGRFLAHTCATHGCTELGRSQVCRWMNGRQVA